MDDKSDVGLLSGHEAVADSSSDSTVFRQRKLSTTNYQRRLASLSYFEHSVDPDKPRLVSAYYDHKSSKKAADEKRPPPSDWEFYFGRTPRELVTCALFYFLFWFFILGSATVFIALQIYTGIISKDHPKFTTMESPLSAISTREYSHRHYYGNPGMGFRPLNSDESNLIWFIPGPRHPETWAPLTGNIDAFLLKYGEKKQYGCKDCSKRQLIKYKDITRLPENAWYRPPWSNRYCCFYIKFLGRQCTRQKGYGYVEGKPCILLKLNKLVNWVPELYKNISEAPAEIHDRFDQRFIGVKCVGVHGPDKEHIGELAYYPKEGFPYWYYPYHHQKRYRQPLVFVQFLNATPGVLVMVECRAYAKNIEIDGGSMTGSVRFEILIDTSPGSPKKSSATSSTYYYHYANNYLTPVFYRSWRVVMPFIITVLLSLSYYEQ